MKTKVILGLILAALCAVLTGCGEDTHIAKVKSTVFNNSTMTTGQALDHRKACESTEWSYQVDDRGQPIVEYRCHFKGVDAFNAKHNHSGPKAAASVDEVYQWVVQDGEDPVLIFGGFEITHVDGTTFHKAWNYLPLVWKAIESDDATDASTYEQRASSYDN